MKKEEKPHTAMAHPEDHDLFNLTLKRVREQEEKKRASTLQQQAATAFTVVPAIDEPRPLRAKVIVPQGVAADQPHGFVKPNWRPTDNPAEKKRVHTASFLHRSTHSATRTAFEHDAEVHGESDSWENVHNVGAIYNNMGRLFAPLWHTLDLTVSAAEDTKCAAWYFAARKF